MASIEDSCKTLWWYAVDTSENSSHFFNSYNTQQRFNENSGQSTIKICSTPKNTYENI